MKGGKLLCETRNENRTVVSKKAPSDNKSKNMRNNKGPVTEEDEEWVLTRKQTPKSKQTSQSKSQDS